MNKKRTLNNLDAAHSSYRGRVHNKLVNTVPRPTIGKPVPMNSFSPGHPVLGNLKQKKDDNKKA